MSRSDEFTIKTGPYVAISNWINSELQRYCLAMTISPFATRFRLQLTNRLKPYISFKHLYNSVNQKINWRNQSSHHWNEMFSVIRRQRPLNQWNRSELNVKITPNFDRQKSILVCYKLKSQLHCMKERLQIKTPARNKFVMEALRTPYATQREMWTNWKQMETKHNLKKSGET